MRVLPKLFRSRIRKGSLTLTGPKGFAETFRGCEPGPLVTFHVRDPSLDWKILLNPELRFAEAYMAGAIEVTEGELRDLVMLLWLNRKHLERGVALAIWKRLLTALRRLHQNNTLLRSRRNVKTHYDLGTDLFKLFLDSEMNYSCAYFSEGNETLEEAQRAKVRQIAAKLCLSDGQRVLDIGCGWGGLACYLARVADVSVHGVTLSEDQLAFARARAGSLGLSDKVTFDLRDYRTVDGTFDRVVSVGMLEHVGASFLEGFFLHVQGLLPSEGVALIHSIASLDPPSVTDSFTRKYIFPGGYIPSMSEMLTAIERSDLWLLDCEIWRKHYAYTLREWSRRFARNREAAKAAYDETFCRMWELYLAGAETAFLAEKQAVTHLLLAHRRDATPITRDYIQANVDQLKSRELDVGITVPSSKSPAPNRVASFRS